MQESEESVLVNRNLVGRCGLYCGCCTIYRAYKDGGEYLKGRAERFKCAPEKVRCNGCMSLTPDCWGYSCKIVQCLRTNNLRSCHQCALYERNSCERFGKLAEGYLEDGVDLRANLVRIKKGEVEEWLRESEERFKCPECGKPLSIGARGTKCYHCGADLSKNQEDKVRFC